MFMWAFPWNRNPLHMRAAIKYYSNYRNRKYTIQSVSEATHYFDTLENPCVGAVGKQVNAEICSVHGKSKNY